MKTTFTVKINRDGSAIFPQDLLRRLDLRMGGELDFVFEGDEWMSVTLRRCTTSELFTTKIQQLLARRIQEIDKDHHYVEGMEDWRPSTRRGLKAESAGD